jgi:hypothetical protein
MHLKKIFLDKDIRMYTGGPLCNESFDTHTPNCEKNFFDLYIVHDPKYHDLRAGGQWTKNIFFAFSILLDGLAHICYIPFENAKKSKIGSL